MQRCCLGRIDNCFDMRGILKIFIFAIAMLLSNMLMGIEEETQNLCRIEMPHIGKMYIKPNLTHIDYIPIKARNLSVRRNDTIFSYNIYHFSGNVDSIVFSGLYVRIHRNKWIGYNNDGDYTISSYKKIKPTEVFLQYNDSIFKGDYEVISTKWHQYSSNGELKASKKTFLGIKRYRTYK